MMGGVGYVASTGNIINVLVGKRSEKDKTWNNRRSCVRNTKTDLQVIVLENFRSTKATYAHLTYTPIQHIAYCYVFRRNSAIFRVAIKQHLKLYKLYNNNNNNNTFYFIVICAAALKHVRSLTM
jgi:hypothetical protein